VNIKTVIL